MKSEEVGVLGGGCILLALMCCGIPSACVSGVENLLKGPLGTGTTNTRTVDDSQKTRTERTMREVNTINLNMRSGPGNGYSVIATFPKKTRIVLYGETKTVDGELWSQASTPNGQTRGWVSRKYLSP